MKVDILIAVDDIATGIGLADIDYAVVDNRAAVGRGGYRVEIEALITLATAL